MSFELVEVDRRLANIVTLGSIAAVDVANAVAQVQIGGILTDWLPWLTARAGNDITWWAPEVGEQVVILSPSGDLAQGVVLPGLYQTAHPAPSNSADKHRTVYSDGTYVEYDRATSVLNVNVNPAGSANIVVGGSNLHLMDDTITANIGGTTLTLKDGQATLKAAAIKLDGPVTCTSTLLVQDAATVQGLLTYEAGMAGSGGTGGASAVIEGGIQASGDIAAGGDVTAGSISLKSHKHGGVKAGGDTSAGPS